jgi:hypothetical protein
MRRAVTIGPVAAAGDEAAVPGMIVLDASMAVVSISHEAKRWLAEIGVDGWPSASELPVSRVLRGRRAGQAGGLSDCRAAACHGAAAH